jgi:hypothetical protein
MLLIGSGDLDVGNARTDLQMDAGEFKKVEPSMAFMLTVKQELKRTGSRSYSEGIHKCWKADHADTLHA